MFIVSFCTKCHVPSPSGSLFMVSKQPAKENTRMTSMFLFSIYESNNLEYGKVWLLKLWFTTLHACREQFQGEWPKYSYSCAYRQF
jgi:hypothetical protein